MHRSMTTMAEMRQPAAKGCGGVLEQNVGAAERMLSAFGGAGLIAFGVSRRSWLLPLAGAALVYRGWSGQCAMYRALGINTAEDGSHEGGVKAQQGRRIDESLHIERTPDELYRYWRDFSNLPKVMRHLESVTEVDERRSHWVARGPFDQRLEWHAEIIADKPGEVISWTSIAESEVDTAGSVEFRPGPNGEGTDLLVQLKYDPPGGRLAATAAYFLGQGLEQAVREDLRLFKQMLEAGETATAAATCSGAEAGVGQ